MYLHNQFKQVNDTQLVAIYIYIYENEKSLKNVWWIKSAQMQISRVL